MSSDHFAPVPLFAFSDSRLTVRDFKVLGILAYFSRLGKKPEADPSRSQIAELTGISYQRISESTARLESFGYIQKIVQRGRSKTNSYVLLKGNRFQDVLQAPKREQKREQIPGHPKKYRDIYNPPNPPNDITENNAMTRRENADQNSNGNDQQNFNKQRQHRDETSHHLPANAAQRNRAFFEHCVRIAAEAEPDTDGLEMDSRSVR